MISGEVVSGQRYGWSLIKKLGEGDAGEVYLVESLLEKKVAILKRPHRSSFSSDIVRQASQIESERKILRALNGLSISQPAVRLAIPGLLDQSRPGAEFSERFFIIIEKAPGFDLNSLLRAVRSGSIGDSDQVPDLTNEEQIFIAGLAKRGSIPDLILLRALSGLIEFFEKIHTHSSIASVSGQSGIVWNDVKPEHLFWDPGQACFTIIDWGNGQFLETDGASKDRRYSRSDDYLQFAQEMGKFLANTAPDLFSQLAWPEEITPTSVYPAMVEELKENIAGLLVHELEALRKIRQKEEDLVRSNTARIKQFQLLEKLHERVICFGELPDFAGAEKFFVKLANRLATQGRLVEFSQLCEKAVKIPGVNLEKWRLLGQISEKAEQGGEPPAPALLQAISASLADDWPEAYWNLLSVAQRNPGAAGWDELANRIRQMQPEIDSAALTPFVIACRLAHTLQAGCQKLADRLSSRSFTAIPMNGEDSPDEQVQGYESLVRIFREEVLKKWQELEPDPPDSGLAYQDIERLLDAIGRWAPDSKQEIIRALDQPQAQVKIVLDAWDRKEFETSRRGLRRLLVWDPERQRVFMAERGILSAPAWLEKMRRGPKKSELLQDFMTQLALEGRELRNQVGPARWLDLILETLSRLRKGSNPADLILEHPEILTELPWLVDYESHRYLAVSPNKSVSLERGQNIAGTPAPLQGMREGALGKAGELLLAEPLDTWVPEARGSSARVFSGFRRSPEGELWQSAIKVMRQDRAEYALPLFREEIQVLTLMRDVPGITGLAECGYIQLDSDQILPPDDKHTSAEDLSGTVLRFGVNDVQNFLAILESKAEAGWLPYLAMERRRREDNLMALCDAGYTRGKFLPLAETVRIAIQICDILEAAHDRHIVYRDHKILHYYWLESYNSIFMIDWNVAKRHPQGLSPTEIQFDLVQFGARALHHILTGRPAPGALPAGPTRPEEIERAAHTYRVQWTYDDQRLPTVLKDILERALSGHYSDARKIKEDLRQVFIQLTGNRN